MYGWPIGVRSGSLCLWSCARGIWMPSLSDWDFLVVSWIYYASGPVLVDNPWTTMLFSVLITNRMDWCQTCFDHSAQYARLAKPQSQ